MVVAEFGFSRWGADIVRLAEPLDVRVPNPLAPRARSLARNDGVTLTVTGTAVRGLVSRGGQASVSRLEFAAMAGGTAVVVREMLGAAPEPDDDVHQRVTTSAGRPVPTIVAADCSCRARSERCVHILATLYALAAAVDHRPTLALELQAFHGMPATGTVTANAPTRWIPLTGLQVRDYWEVPEIRPDRVDS